MPPGGCPTPFIVDDMHIFINIGHVDTEWAHFPPDLVIVYVVFLFCVNRMRYVTTSLRCATTRLSVASPPCMMTSSNINNFRVTGLLCGEFIGHRLFPTQRPVTQSFDVFFDLSLNQQLSKQRRRWWFETPSRSLWRNCNDHAIFWRILFAPESNMAIQYAEDRWYLHIIVWIEVPSVWLNIISFDDCHC